MNTRFLKWLLTVSTFFCMIVVATNIAAKKPVKPPKPPPPPPTSAEYQVVFEEMYRSGATDLVVVNSDGSDRRVILDAARGELYTQAQFSPDGEKIVFVGGDPDIVGIYTINTDGTGLNLVATLRGGVGSGSKTHAPVFSRTLINGKEMILFNDTPLYDVYSTDIYVVPADGSDEPRNITNSTDIVEINNVWSDDGTFIITEGRDYDTEGTGYDIYRLEFNLSTMSVTSSTNITAGTDLSGLSRNLSMAKEAGDNRICVVTDDDKLYIMETDGVSSPQLIITDPLLDSAAFLPDGSGFVVDTSTEIYLVGINGDFVQLVTTLAKKAQSIRLPDIRSISANTE